jgi:hypothetical protein
MVHRLAAGAGRAGAAVGIVALLLAGCAPASRGPASPGPATRAPASAAKPAVVGGPVDAALYEVVAERSELRVLVYRGGPLARLGHNHVLVTRELRGNVQVGRDDVRFEVSFPVASLALDAAAARAAEGPDFESRPTPADVEGTRRNLEGPQVLDAGRFPRIALHGLGATGGPADWRVRAAVEVRGEVHEVDAPARVERDADGLVARGEFELRQTALGLTPFSVAMGALQVRDELTVRYVLVAARR